MMNIEQPRNDKSGHNHPPAKPRNSEHGFNQVGGGGENRGWQKNHKQRQRKQYCFFHGEEKGHSTRDCPHAKETQERIKNRSAPQPPPSVIQPREVNHTFPQSFYHSYVGGSIQQHPAPIQPNAFAFAYYPSFLPAWRLAQQPAEQGQQPTYAPPTLANHIHRNHAAPPAIATPSTKSTSVNPSSTPTKTRTSP